MPIYTERAKRSRGKKESRQRLRKIAVEKDVGLVEVLRETVGPYEKPNNTNAEVNISRVLLVAR